MGLLSIFKSKRTKSALSSNNMVLIGTVKTPEQLDLSLEKKFYHIPFSVLIPEFFAGKRDLHRIKHIALYQSVNYYGNDAGIRYIGVVNKISVVRRKDIKCIPKESNALYVLFEIAEWQIMEESVEVAEVGIYPAWIVPFGNFKASKETPELFLNTSLERELYRFLKKLSTDVNFKNFEFGGYEFYDENDNLVIVRDGVCYLQLPMEVIRDMPQSGFETVMKSIEFND